MGGARSHQHINTCGGAGGQGSTVAAALCTRVMAAAMCTRVACVACTSDLRVVQSLFPDWDPGLLHAWGTGGFSRCIAGLTLSWLLFGVHEWLLCMLPVGGVQYCACAMVRMTTVLIHDS